MSHFQDVFDAEKIAAGIAEWASIESPSSDATAVNRMMDHAERTMSSMGAAIERTPGTDGYGDVLRARFEWGDSPGILILGHLDTVHLVGTLAESLAVSRGDKLFGPGFWTHGGHLAVHATSKIIERRAPARDHVHPGRRDRESLHKNDREKQKRRYVLVPELGPTSS